MITGYAPRLPIKQFPSQVPTPGVPQNLPPLPGMPTMGNHMFNPGALGSYQQQAQGLLGNQGPYGAQALQLAGLLGLGGQQQLPVMGSPYTPSMFMPGFRPGIDQPIRGRLGTPRGNAQEY